MIADLRVNGADVFRCSCALKQDSESNADPTCPTAPVSLLGCVDASPITSGGSDPGLSGGGGRTGTGHVAAVRSRFSGSLTRTPGVTAAVFRPTFAESGMGGPVAA